MKPSSVRLILGTILVLAAAGAIVGWQTVRVADAPLPIVNPNLQIGGPFTLTDHHGKTVTDADYRGRYLLIFFGYTFCPDVCPTELQTVAVALESLGEAGKQVLPLFISVDPQRDTPSHLAEFVQQFHPQIVGLTGTPEQIAAVARAYRAYYAKAPGSDPAHYLIDHSAFLYLMAPNGQFLTVFRNGTSPETLAADLRQRLATPPSGAARGG